MRKLIGWCHQKKKKKKKKPVPNELSWALTSKTALQTLSFISNLFILKNKQTRDSLSWVYQINASEFRNVSKPRFDAVWYTFWTTESKQKIHTLQKCFESYHHRCQMFTPCLHRTRQFSLAATRHAPQGCLHWMWKYNHKQSISLSKINRVAPPPV